MRTHQSNDKDSCHATGELQIQFEPSVVVTVWQPYASCLTPNFI